MPIMEYRCDNRHLEAHIELKRVPAGVPRLCSTCGKPMKRTMSVPSMIRMGARVKEYIKEPYWEYPDGKKEPLY